MAVEVTENSRSRRRKRGFPRRKLLTGEKVELRSLEEGFLGSWHPGTVISYGRMMREVRYENVLDDDGVNYVVEEVKVSNALDDVIPSSNGPKRGILRPVPPPSELRIYDLHFGLCVDVKHQEAWWEGVIYDHFDGEEERSVFFPDLGDEMKVEIDQLRITQDWDEVTEQWERRGNWVFLELLEECEAASFVAVSAKQIWYDVREKEDFNMIGEWTLNKKNLLKEMVMEVINEYLTLTVKAVNSYLNLPSCLLNETPELESVEPMTGVELEKSLARKQISVQEEHVPSPVKVILPNSPKQVSYHDAAGKVVSGGSCSGKKRKSRYSSCPYWKCYEVEAESCPDAIKQYVLVSSKRASSIPWKPWKDKVLKHLAYLGWKTEWSRKTGIQRYRYKSPVNHGQKVYMSLLEVCKDIQKDSNMSQNDPTIDCHRSPVLFNPSVKLQDLDISPPVVPSAPVDSLIEPEFCPQAVVEYYSLHTRKKDSLDKKKWIEKAKKHLLAEGWIFDYPSANNRRRGTIYIAPKNQRFRTLHAACKFCIIESSPNWTISNKQPLNASAINEEYVDQVLNDDLLCKVSQSLRMKPELLGIDGKAANRTSNRKSKFWRNSKASLRVLRSSKRLQKVSALSLLHHKPLNVLSWLIDCNMVLPRSKLYYKEKGGGLTKTEGRVTRDGIKCNCCLTVYGFSGFANHASRSRTGRPAARIFLEDGRSLLDCQMQIMENHQKRETIEKPFNGFCQGENDYICSICHYGGDLILCDQCPSSFHKMCLGLKDTPDGDWFCPSCRCGICGQSQINGDEDGHFLTCIQCEHKYHVRCLENRGVHKAGNCRKNWFCGKDCEKIYAGLHKLLGTPVLVGDNLTWTLVKYINSASSDLGGTRRESMAESFSKLNVALSIMHECFEPLTEPSSSKDLVDDVIFSRWSELNRLNFRGFYTVLLERNEELISVATIRVYGEKVAEVPLVGTRLQYRRHGMCRILMNELEKKLMQLGVERLVLPAVPSVLDTWTGSFGFSKMTNLERSQFLDHTFLDFQGTIMCQKLLAKSPSPNSVLSLESLQKSNIFSRSCRFKNDRPSPVSEVNPAEEIDKRGMLDQHMMDIFPGNNYYQSSVAIVQDPVTMQPCPEDQQCQNGTSPPHCSIDKQADRFSIKYYRRKVRKT